MIRRSDFTTEIYVGMTGLETPMFSRPVNISSGDFYSITVNGKEASVFATIPEVNALNATNVSSLVVGAYYCGLNSPIVSIRSARKLKGVALWFDTSNNVVRVLCVNNGKCKWEPCPHPFPRLWLDDCTKLFQKQWIAPDEMCFYVPGWESAPTTVNVNNSMPMDSDEFDKFLLRLAEKQGDL